MISMIAAIVLLEQNSGAILNLHRPILEQYDKTISSQFLQRLVGRHWL